MTTSLNTRCKNMILGALVADAAAMGLHWIYDQPHIRKIAPESPEFKAPDARNYEGIPAYFAHPTKTAGALSQYGEQAFVMLRALSRSNGTYSASDYADSFQTHFGYGGAFVGYIDHATRETLDNFRRLKDAAQACADALPFAGEKRIKNDVLAKVLALTRDHTDDALAPAVEAALLEGYDDTTIAQFGVALAADIATLSPATGAADLQLPATAKLPALVAALTASGLANGPDFTNPVASAIRITNDHPVAAQYGMVCANMMRAALTDGTTAAAISAGLAAASAEVAAVLETALAMSDQNTEALTQHFGMACDLPFGVPSALHNIATAPSFADAVQRNIYAGGDSCGRAIIVGAIMGAVHGVGGAHGIPPDWIARLGVNAEVSEILSQLFD